MKRWVFILLLTPTFAQAVVNLSTTWTETGDYKMSAGDTAPWVNGVLCSSCELSNVWDGHSINLWCAKGELCTWVTYLICGNTTCSNVNVTISSFTGTTGDGFAAVTRSSGSVWDFSQAPYALYKYTYLQTVGKHEIDTYWDNSEYDEQQLPYRYQNTYTVNANNDGICVPPGCQWANRHDANAYRPDPAVPIEMFSSSFTVSGSSSQAIGGEVYVSTGLVVNSTYTATITVWEGSTVSTTIPVNLFVPNVTMPTYPNLTVYAACGYPDIDAFMYGSEFPSEDSDPYLTGHLRLAAFVHRHRILCAGDYSTAGNYWPHLDYQKHLDGSAYKESYGLAWNTSPGYGAPDKTYIIGLYGGLFGSSHGAVSTSTLTGVNGYCTAISSWTKYCSDNSLKCYEYTANDEAPASILHSEDEILALHNSSMTECQYNGSTMSYLQTGSLEVVASTAPDIQAVWSTQWIPQTSSTVYQNLQNVYLNSSTHSVAGYNSNLGVDSMFSTEEDGIGPREISWGAYKTGMTTWFMWYINAWLDLNNGNQAQNGWNALAPAVTGFGDYANQPFVIDKNFGYDAFPSTDTAKGHFGFSFAHDGIMIYPGEQTFFSTQAYALNGFIGSWNLNQMTRGIEDYDLITQAKAINPAATTAILNAQVQDVMYLRNPFTTSDPSYSYGPRPWNQDTNSWEGARRALMQIIATSSTNNSIQFQGTIQFKGVATVE